MKNLSKHQIEQVKQIKTWTSTSFHGNTKKVGNFNVSDFKSIVEKKRTREILKLDQSIKSNTQIVRELITESLRTKNTNYFKVIIEGNTSLYYASPIYGHGDYNKSRLFEKNEKTLKLMDLFNSIIKK